MGNFCLWDLELGKFLFVGSGIQEIFVCGIRKYGMFLLVESELQEIFVGGICIRENFIFVGSKIVALESLIPAQGIRKPR